MRKSEILNWILIILGYAFMITFMIVQTEVRRLQLLGLKERANQINNLFYGVYAMLFILIIILMISLKFKSFKELMKYDRMNLTIYYTKTTKDEFQGLGIKNHIPIITNTFTIKQDSAFLRNKIFQYVNEKAKKEFPTLKFIDDLNEDAIKRLNDGYELKFKVVQQLSEDEAYNMYDIDLLSRFALESFFSKDEIKFLKDKALGDENALLKASDDRLRDLNEEFMQKQIKQAKTIINPRFHEKRIKLDSCLDYLTREQVTFLKKNFKLETINELIFNDDLGQIEEQFNKKFKTNLDFKKLTGKIRTDLKRLENKFIVKFSDLEYGKWIHYKGFLVKSEKPRLCAEIVEFDRPILLPANVDRIQERLSELKDKLNNTEYQLAEQDLLSEKDRRVYKVLMIMPAPFEKTFHKIHGEIEDFEGYPLSTNLYDDNIALFRSMCTADIATLEIKSCNWLIWNTDKHVSSIPDDKIAFIEKSAILKLFIEEVASHEKDKREIDKLKSRIENRDKRADREFIESLEDLNTDKFSDKLSKLTIKTNKINVFPMILIIIFSVLFLIIGYNLGTMRALMSLGGG
ncbi:MAG: hypothetical protein ACTSYS_13880 [Promethearchaeota archaeon]